MQLDARSTALLRSGNLFLNDMPVEETISVPSEDPKKVEKKQDEEDAKKVNAKPSEKDDKSEELVRTLFNSTSPPH